MEWNYHVRKNSGRNLWTEVLGPAGGELGSSLPDMVCHPVLFCPFCLHWHSHLCICVANWSSERFSGIPAQCQLCRGQHHSKERCWKGQDWWETTWAKLCVPYQTTDVKLEPFDGDLLISQCRRSVERVNDVCCVLTFSDWFPGRLDKPHSLCHSTADTKVMIIKQ